MEKTCKFCKKDKNELSDRSFISHQNGCSNNPKKQKKVKRICQYCKIDLFKNLLGVVNHEKWCKENPNSKKLQESYSRNRNKTLVRELGEYRDFQVICSNEKCKRKFTIQEREKQFPLKERYFCNRSCSSTFSTSKDNKQITKVLECIVCSTETSVNKRTDPKKVKCKECRDSELIQKCLICGEIKGQCSKKDICSKYRQIKYLVKYFGFDNSTLGTNNSYKEYDRVREILRVEYEENLLTLNEIGLKYFGKWNSNIEKILIMFNIKRRSLSEAGTLSVEKNGIRETIIYPYKNYHHTTWEGKTYFLRSSYELDFTTELDLKKIKYEVEDLRVRYFDTQEKRERIAIPDFYLPETNEIVEIKSSYTYDEQNMKDRVKVFRELGYGFRLILDKIEIEIDY